MRTSSVVARCQPWFYLRLVAYSFFWLSEGGIWLIKRLAVLEAHSPPERAYGYSPSNQSVGRTEVVARYESGKKSSRPGAQAACCFRCSASKRTPFFQTSKVMAAILRANVRRAHRRFSFLGPGKLRRNSERGPLVAAAQVAAPLKIFFRSWLWFDVESADG